MESVGTLPASTAELTQPPTSPTQESTYPAEPETEEENPVLGEIVMVSDIHYLAEELTDRGERFQNMVEYGDGKLVQYIDEITAAFLEETRELSPEVLILSGDLTLNGELLSHQRLAAKLKEVQDTGIQVLVIPGNHDINNPAAAEFKGNAALPAAYTTPADFLNTYKEFGYSQAIARDEDSLSYVYQLDEETRILMIDTCQYEPQNLVGGMIGTETYGWIEEQLSLAYESGIKVIPVSHHNLLDESEVYVADCTIEHSEQLVNMLEDWDVYLYFSGHLHVQHSKYSDGSDGGVFEMVTSSLSTPPCQYGILTRMKDGSYQYHTKKVDMEGWSQIYGIEDENLKKFNTYKMPFLKRVFYNQAQTAMKDKEISSANKDRMANLYGDLKTAYYEGTAYRLQTRIEDDAAYMLWQEHMFDDILLQYMQSIIADAQVNYNQATIQ